MAFGRPNLVLLLGEEPRDDYETMKVAEIVRGPTGQLALSETYVPPCLRISASAYLVGAIRQIAARVISKQRELAEGRGQREPSGITECWLEGDEGGCGNGHRGTFRPGLRPMRRASHGLSNG